MFSTFEKLLHHKAESKLPLSDNDEALANSFADFFTHNIIKIRGKLQVKWGNIHHAPEDLLYYGLKLDYFDLVSCDDLSSLICKPSVKACALDPIPSLVLRNCLGFLLSFIAKFVNCFLTAVVTADMKRAIVRPSSKCCEKVVAVQLLSHLQEKKLEEIFRSAYKVGHSTESGLLRVHNDILSALDEDRGVMLLLLDLSEAFDTVDHRMPLSRLSQCAAHWKSIFSEVIS